MSWTCSESDSEEKPVLRKNWVILPLLEEVGYSGDNLSLKEAYYAGYHGIRGPRGWKGRTPQGLLFLGLGGTS